MERIDRSYIRKMRSGVQWAVFLFLLWAGNRFYLYTEDLFQGSIPTVARPPSIEGFLPIGALMSLKLWITTGIFDTIHPAALVIFFAALLVSLMVRKSFCGWICPVGTFSDLVWKTGEKVFGRNFRMPRCVDYPLRSLKYLLMGFFLYVILVKMTPSDILGFLETPYWKVTDIKMLMFFTQMSQTTAITLAVLGVMSLLYRNFWCRYLCPYGALAGLLGAFSPVRIQRNDGACIHCGLCARHCPSSLPVDRKAMIRSPECVGCMSCVSRCPARGALDAGIMGGSQMRPLVVIGAVLAIFFAPILIAQVTGRWHSSLSVEELLVLVPMLDLFTHP